MADFITGGGKEITFDLEKITEREYRALIFDTKQTLAEEDEIITRVSGLTEDEYLDLTKLDKKKLWTAFFKKCKDPLSDPN